MNEAVQLPAFLANRPSRGGTQSLAALSVGSPPHISIKGNRFKLVDAAGNERMIPEMYLDGVIVNVNDYTSKTYYDSGFDPNASEFKPPACFSDNGVAPSRQALKPQHANCRDCPHNQWGSETSRISGKPTKSCNDGKKIAVLVGDMAFLMRIPPGSLKPLGAYARSLAGQSIGDRSVSPEDVMTRFEFDPNAVGILQFKAVAWVDEKTAKLTDELWRTKATDDLVGKNDQPFTGTVATTLPPAEPAVQHQLPPPPTPPAAAAPSAPAPASPAEAVAPKGRTRRTKAEIEADELRKQIAEMQARLDGTPGVAATLPVGGPQQAASQTRLEPVPAADLDIPPFLRRDAATQQSPAAPQQQFGMQAAAEPNADLMKALNLALPPTGG